MFWVRLVTLLQIRVDSTPCRYSNIVCSGYPLGALDSIQSDGSTNWSALKIQWLDISKPQPWQYFPHSCSLRLSAMYLILNGPKEEHLNMLEGGIIAKLLDEKWSTFAKVGEIKILKFLLTRPSGPGQS